MPVEVVKRPSSGEGRTPGGMAGFVVGVGASRREGPDGAFEDVVGIFESDPPDTPTFRLRKDMLAGIEWWKRLGCKRRAHVYRQDILPDLFGRIFQARQTEYCSNNEP